MKRNLFAVGFPLVLAGVVMLGTSALAGGHRPATPQHATALNETGSAALHRIMSDKTSVPMTGNVDKDFATMMTTHHQQGIKMMDVMLQRGHNAELKALAEKMKAAQLEEIRQMAPYTN